jgi:AcrR family transcriptional regulator
MPRTGMSPEKLKDKAITLAIQRIRKTGFEKVRLVDIAKDLGVSHAALYGHFKDKSALLDLISERWLTAMDTTLENICNKAGDPVLKLHQWFLTLHRMKREKILRDPELFKGFNLAAEVKKKFVQFHLENGRRQLTGLVKEAMDQKKIRKDSPDAIAQLLFEATGSFHHPKLVAQYLEEKREALLKRVLETLLRGLEP